MRNRVLWGPDRLSFKHSALIDMAGAVNDIANGNRNSVRKRGLDAVETAIRNALERGDASDPAFRERVYRSAFAVLERSIKARPDLSDEGAERRRDHLKAQIGSIESEFVPAQEAATGLGPTVPPRDTPAGHVPVQAPAEPVFSPLQEAASAPPVQPIRPESPFTSQPPLRPSAPTADPDLGSLLTEEDLTLDDEVSPAEPSIPTGPEFEPVGERRDYASVGDHDHLARPRPRRRAARLLAGLIVVLAILAGLWWLFGSDILGVSNLSTEPVATAPAGGDVTGEDGNWIVVFTPSDPTRAIATGGAQAKVVTHGEDTFLKISSPSADQPVSFQVGQGILEKLAGHEAVFDIIARAEDGQKTQIAVSCDLGSLGDCGRSRFEVGGTVSDFLVRTQLGNEVPSGGGTISIVPDVTGGGKTLEILRIRASAANG